MNDSNHQTDRREYLVWQECRVTLRNLETTGQHGSAAWLTALLEVQSAYIAYVTACETSPAPDPRYDLHREDANDYRVYMHRQESGETAFVNLPGENEIDPEHIRPVTLIDSDIRGGHDFHGRAEYLIYQHECAHLDMVDALYFRGQATADDVNAQVRRVALAFRNYAGELKHENPPRKKARKDIRLSGSAAR